MLNYIIKLTSSIDNRVYEFISNLKSIVDFKLNRDRKLSKHELGEVYLSLAKALESSVPIHDRLKDIAESKIAAGRKNKAEVYFDIAHKVRNPRVTTPISAAFKNYIPKTDFQLMSRSEYDNCLKDALPLIQKLTIVNRKLSIQTLKFRLYFFLNFIMPVMLYVYIDDYFKLQVGAFGYGKDLSDPFYIKWHAVSEFFFFFNIIFVFICVLYTIFYYKTRDNHPIGLRLYCDYLPLFRNYSKSQVISALVNVSVSIDVSMGTPLPKIVRGLVRFSTLYVGSIMEQLAREIERTNFRNAISSIKIIPSDLVETMSLRLAEGTKNTRLSDAAISSIEMLIDSRARVHFLVALFGMIFQLIAFMYPSLATTPYVTSKFNI